jgi:hypothetical protein
MPRPSYAFRVEGIEPARSPAWKTAGESVRRAFWRAVVGYTLAAKDLSLARGEDRAGAELTPIAASTRKRRRSALGPADPDAPPLTPARAKSRTRALLAGRAFADHAEFFWRKDPITGKSWGVILGYHRKGGEHLPVRDVIGLAPEDLAKVRKQARRWWDIHRPPVDRIREAELAVGVRFAVSEAGRMHGDLVVLVDVARVEADLAKDAAFHVGPDGKGGKPGSYAVAFRQVAAARAGGKPVAMPRMGLDVEGSIVVNDGRHRFAVLRDQGARALPVSVPEAEAAAIRAKYGPRPAAPKPARAALAAPAPPPAVVHVKKRKHLSKKVQVYEE